MNRTQQSIIDDPPPPLSTNPGVLDTLLTSINQEVRIDLYFTTHRFSLELIQFDNFVVLKFTCRASLLTPSNNLSPPWTPVAINSFTRC